MIYNNNVRVLICDDAGYVRQILWDLLEEAGVTDIWECGNGDEFGKLVRSLQPDLILLDLVLPQRNGVELLREIISGPDPLSKHPEIWIISSFEREELPLAADNLANFAWIKKPFQKQDIQERLQAFTKKTHQTREIA